MSTPIAPEYAAILAQKILLEQITGGANWHTSIGSNVVLRTNDESEPFAHIALAGWRSEPNSVNDAVLYIDWSAVVPIASDSDLTSALVLADMRAALTCGSDKIRLVDVAVQLREPGSNYALVGVTTAIHTPTR